MKKSIWNALILSLIPIFTSACNKDEKPAADATGSYSASAPAEVAESSVDPAKKADVLLPQDPDARAWALVAQMSLDEKIQFIHTDHRKMSEIGSAAGHIPGLPRLKIPELLMIDSSAGSRSKIFKSTTFPATLAIAASWDRDLAYLFAAEVAKQARAQGYGMGLGGGANLVRDPRVGRMFEYLGEDPLLAGKMLASRTEGTQSQHVIATIKHMVGNEQEAHRTEGSSVIDERTLRQIYMLPFEIAVQESQPGNVMCSYNQLSLDGYAPGIWACEHPHILTDILKREWGFKGQVQSDWGATHSTAAAINAGLDEDEHYRAAEYFVPAKVKAALEAGEITIERLNEMVHRKLRTMISIGVMDNPPPNNQAEGFVPDINFAAAEAVAQKAAEQSIVLLKNQPQQAPLDAKTPRKLLPLDASKLKKIAVAGAHADKAILVGSGSGSVTNTTYGSFPLYDGKCRNIDFPQKFNPCFTSNPWKRVKVPMLEAIRNAAPSAEVVYGGSSDEAEPFRPYTEQEIDDAVKQAQQADVAIVVVAQPAGEMADLGTLGLNNARTAEGKQGNQDELVRRIAAVNRNTIVVVESGNPILMPWINDVSAVLEVWYPGDNGGPAIANVLFGKVNPSGKLPVTFPKADTDTPTAGKEWEKNPVYAERLNVGYRWYDSKGVEPLFEFGFGLSYTEFHYSDLRVTTDGDGSKTATFTLENTGTLAGRETPQIYAQFPASSGEPPKRLVGWDKVELQPGEKKTVSVKIAPKLQSIWDVANAKWKLVPPAKILVGASSRQIKLEL